MAPRSFSVAVNGGAPVLYNESLPFTLPGVGSGDDVVVVPLGPSVANLGEGVFSALGAAKAKMAASQDTTILVVGDSTGNEMTEKVYKVAAWLASLYPTQTVRYFLWNDATPGYTAGTTLQTGTGSGTLRVYNGSIGGTQPNFLMGSKFAAAIAAVPTPDLVLWNHGQNVTAEQAFSLPAAIGRFMGAMAQVQKQFPNSPHAMWLQNPRGNNNVYEAIPRPAILRTVALRGGLLMLDEYSKYIAAGKPSPWYDPDDPNMIHPSGLGHDNASVPAFKENWLAAKALALAPPAPWMSSIGDNLLLNGKFTDWTGSTPASWSGVSVTASKEASIVYDGAPYSAKLVGTGAQSRLFQNLSAGARATAIAAGKVTLTTVRFVPEGAAQTVGRPGVTVTAASLGGAVSNNWVVNDNLYSGFGGWQVAVAVADLTIPSDTTAIQVILYADSASSPDSNPAYYAGAMLTAGSVPAWF